VPLVRRRTMGGCCRPRAALPKPSPQDGKCDASDKRLRALASCPVTLSQKARRKEIQAAGGGAVGAAQVALLSLFPRRTSDTHSEQRASRAERGVRGRAVGEEGEGGWLGPGNAARKKSGVAMDGRGHGSAVVEPASAVEGM
jgi:hypothetical protein